MDVVLESSLKRMGAQNISIYAHTFSACTSPRYFPHIVDIELNSLVEHLKTTFDCSLEVKLALASKKGSFLQLTVGK